MTFSPGRYLRIRPRRDDDADVVVDRLWLCGASAIGEEDRGGDVVLVAGFDDDANVERASAAVSDIAEVAVVVDDESWWDAWRAHATPIVVELPAGAARARTAGDRAAPTRLVVAPAWLDGTLDGVDGTVVAIEPGRTFGSGAHPTTRLVLAELLHLAATGALGPSSVMLDIGCGSGVLAIAAARLAAGRVLGVDVDEDALAIAQANVVRNGVADRVAITTGGVAALADAFTVVVANVLLPVHRELLPDIVRLTTEGSVVVLSGVLDEQYDALVTHLGPLRVVARRHCDGWLAVRCTRL